VFVGTKFGASRLAVWLERQGVNATAIHGDKSQQQRTEALEAFKSGTVRVLVATDVAARGLDIEDLPHVINFELPHNALKTTCTASAAPAGPEKAVMPPRWSVRRKSRAWPISKS
jgi:superfamily II DNA/RNA helicase